MATIAAAQARDAVTNLFGQHVSPQVVERLLASANEITAQMRRLQMFQEAQLVIVAEAPAIFIGTLINRVPMRSDVQGFSYNPLLGNTFDLYGIHKG